MKKVDVSGYLAPDRAPADTAGDGQAIRPKRDITYSVVFGYGFRPSTKTRRKDPKPIQEKD